MTTCKLDDLRFVRSLVIGNVFRRGRLEREVIGVEWGSRRNTWMIQWRRGSNACYRSNLEDWKKWQSEATLIFDAIDGPTLGASAPDAQRQIDDYRTGGNAQKRGSGAQRRLKVTAAEILNLIDTEPAH